MAHRINKITITNFKAFAGDPFELKLDGGKHLLLYGENGTGKSSIYWSIYTHLQSCLKPQDITGAGKYFDPNNSQHLRNRYSSETDDSSIEIEFIDTKSKVRSIYTISKDLINTADGNDMFMLHTLSLSDFINYKYLYSTFDFRNSQDADIFDMFERDFFSTLDFPESLHKVDDTDTGLLNVGEWWKYLTQTALTELEKHSNGSYDIRFAGYGKHKDYIDKFNFFMRGLILKIQYNTNELLKKGLYLPIEISMRYEPMAFNLQNYRGSRGRDGKITKPKIIITAKLKEDSVSDENKQISHPQSFLNEAKLTRLSLALRLAIIDLKNDGRTARGAQILCMDDMLISLDMSNRLCVVDYMLNRYSGQYQLLFMTHDRALYRIIEDRIQARNLDRRWVKRELYLVEPEVSKADYPYPEIVEVKDPVSVARNYFFQHDYSACALILRRQCERMLKWLLPRNLQYDDDIKPLDLAGMIAKMSQFYAMYDMPDMLPNIDIYRMHILNPLSHDDLTSNMYREEMVRCIDDVGTLSQYRKGVIVDCNEQVEMFEMTINGQKIELEVSEVWDYVQDNLGVKHYKNVPVKIKASDLDARAVGDVRDIRVVYEDACNRARLAADARPAMETTIVHMPDSKPLVDY